MAVEKGLQTIQEPITTLTTRVQNYFARKVQLVQMVTRLIETVLEGCARFMWEFICGTWRLLIAVFRLLIFLLPCPLFIILGLLINGAWSLVFIALGIIYVFGPITFFLKSDNDVQLTNIEPAKPGLQQHIQTTIAIIDLLLIILVLGLLISSMKT